MSTKKLSDSDYINNFSVFGGFAFDASHDFMKNKAFQYSIVEDGYKINVFDKTLFKASKYVNFMGTVGDFAGYYEGVQSFYNNDPLNGSISIGSNYTGVVLGKACFVNGFIWDIGWNIGSGLGKELSQTRVYNDLMPIHPSISRERGVKNGWWNAKDEAVYQNRINLELKTGRYIFNELNKKL